MMGRKAWVLIAFIALSVVQSKSVKNEELMKSLLNSIHNLEEEHVHADPDQSASDRFPWFGSLVGTEGEWHGENEGRGFTYQTSFFQDFPVFVGCGGSLIFPDWVLTAAHCFNQETLNLQPDEEFQPHLNRISATHSLDMDVFTYVPQVVIESEDRSLFNMGKKLLGFGESKATSWHWEFRRGSRLHDGKPNIVVREFDRVFIHRRFVKESDGKSHGFTRDIALVHLKIPILDIRPVSIASIEWKIQKAEKVSIPLYSIGFGRRQRDTITFKDFSIQKQSRLAVGDMEGDLSQPAIRLRMGQHSQTQCRGLMNMIPWYICTLGEKNALGNRVVADSGDSGGPLFISQQPSDVVMNKQSSLVVDAKLVGILNFGSDISGKDIADPERGNTWVDLTVDHVLSPRRWLRRFFEALDKVPEGLQKDRGIGDRLARLLRLKFIPQKVLLPAEVKRSLVI